MGRGRPVNLAGVQREEQVIWAGAGDGRSALTLALSPWSPKCVSYPLPPPALARTAASPSLPSFPPSLTLALSPLPLFRLPLVQQGNSSSLSDRSEGEGRETSSSYQFRGLNLCRFRFSPPQDEENNCMYLGGSLRLK